MSVQILNIINLIFVIVTIITSVNGTVSYLKQDTQTHSIKFEPTRFNFFELYKQKQTKGTEAQKERHIINNLATESTKNKKWQVGRVSRKQFEIINMLWRKTKEFSDMKISTTTHRPGCSTVIPQHWLNPTFPTSTPSFIEFYYFDESKDIAMNSSSLSREHKYKNITGALNSVANYANFAFRRNDRNSVQLAFPTLIMNIKQILQTKDFSSPSTPTFKAGNVQRISNYVPYTTATSFKTKSTFRSSLSNKLPQGTETNIASNKEASIMNLYSQLHDGIFHNWPKSTIISDRIRFFEEYDRNTPSPLKGRTKQLMYIRDLDGKANEFNFSNDQKRNLERADNRVNQQSKREEPKYDIYHKNIERNSRHLKDSNTGTVTEEPIMRTTPNNIRKLQLKDSLASEFNPSNLPLNSTANVSLWSEFSFMAAYIYEPSQVHCDAAGISPHWLVTSASCLSRHHKNPGGGGQSAFVAYCSAHWWKTERVAYVKYSVVHPNYQQRDMNRRYLYNIGLIQVVISMSTCTGWAPIPLMFHKFTADPAGSKAYAIGWGLDRYDTRYTSADLPKYPLTLYEGSVYSDSCPGNLGYSQVKQTYAVEGIKNVYCLSLPPYSGEKYDAIHGSILTIDGKLLATYLQEERRASGQQCAEYTGAWRLTSWVASIAKEPEGTFNNPFSIFLK